MSDEQETFKFRKLWLDLLAVSTGFATVTFAYYVHTTIIKNMPRFTDLLFSHFDAIVLLPFSICASTILMILLKHSDGEIEFKAFGVEFRGASGQAAMWLICFLVQVGAIKLLWN